MRSTGRLSRNNRGVGSIVGGTFLVLILISGFLFYALVLNVTQHYNDTIGSMSEADWNRSREQLVIKDVRITSANKLNVTVENRGSVSSRLVWLGIFNKTATPESQQYSALSEQVESAETKSIVSDFVVVKGKKYVVQIVTELGNIVENKFYPASAVNCALTLMTASPTAYEGNNVTVLLTVTNNDTEVDIAQNLTISLQTNLPALVQVMEQPSSLYVESLGRGQSLFLKWVYNTVNTGTVTFNATYDQAPLGAFALSTVTITTAPAGGQGQMTITGQSCYSTYNPLQWNLLGSTTYVSGSILDLVSNNSNYAIFNSYSSGSSIDINDFVDNNVSDVDGSPNKGINSNFTAQQYGPDLIYDTLTEADTVGAPLTITFVNVGAEATGTGAVTPALPASMSSGDICILVATTRAGGTVTITATGSVTPWTAITGSPVDVTLGEKLYVWWGRWTSGTTGPTVTPGSNHIEAGIGAWRNCLGSGSPIDVSETGTETTSDTTFSFATTISTTVNGCMAIAICTTGEDINTNGRFTTMTDSSLTFLAERMDYETNSGGGGGFALDEGYKAIAGAVGTWASTLTTASTKAYISFALKPALSANYELDYEFQWTSVDYNQANEWLCIYGGAMGAETIRVDVWNGSAWNNVRDNLSSGWNNVSISSYLVSSNFTIRFKGGSEIGDLVQDSWNIDVSLLHLWFSLDQYTAEVEFIGSSNLESWTSLLWYVQSCWDTGQVTVTIQLYNSTLGSYVTSGDGYVSYVSSATPNTNELKSQNITSGLVHFRNATGYWRVKIKGVKSTVSQFQMKVDWAEIQTTYTLTGNSIPYNAWVWYTLKAADSGGGAIPYAYISIYANGTSAAFRNAVDKSSVMNPGWMRLDANGEYQLELKSTSVFSETFILYVVVGDVVGQKTITQEAP